MKTNTKLAGTALAAVAVSAVGVGTAFAATPSPATPGPAAQAGHVAADGDTIQQGDQSTPDTPTGFSPVTAAVSSVVVSQPAAPAKTPGSQTPDTTESNSEAANASEPSAGAGVQ